MALGVVPEAIAFSLVAGVDPKMGLFASVAICCVVALLMGPLVAAHGVAYLLAATLLAGLFRILWGYLRLGYQMRFVPRAVTLGFVNAIGLLIFRAQLPQMGLGADGGETVASLGGVAVSWSWVWLLVALGLAIIYGLPRLTTAVPSTLVAVMIMVSISTFNWESFRAIRRVPKSDTAVMAVTMLIALLTSNLAIAVLVGVALAGILLSRKVAKVITVDSSWLEPEHRLYSVRGQLFFVSTVSFIEGFDLRSHPQRITINMGNAHIWDQTGVRALDQVIRKLRQGGSQVEVLDLNAESLDLFGRISDAPELVEGARCEPAR